MKDEDNIAITIIRSRIEHCKRTIITNPGEENIGVRIIAQGKIVMLEKIIQEIEQTVKRLE